MGDIVDIGTEVSEFIGKPDLNAIADLVQRAFPTPDEPERPVFDYAGVLFEGLILGQWFVDSSLVARHVVASLFDRNGIVIDPADPRLVKLADDVAHDKASSLTVAAVLRKVGVGPL